MACQRTDAPDETSIKCSQFTGLSSNSKMYSKAIVSFAFLAMAIADIRIGHNMPRVQLPHTRNFETRVVGGSPAPVGQYKFIVSLQYKGLHFCGGSILNKDVIITAAHCVNAIPNLSDTTVVAGKYSLKIKETTEQTVNVSKTVVHLKYRGEVGPNDIALLKLASPLKLNNDVQAIALPQANSEPTGVAWLSGWGSISSINSPVMPSKLQHVQMQFLDHIACDKVMTKFLGFPSPVDETNICTSPGKKPLSACSGDSGGPLISIDGGKQILQGIVSWGVVPCGVLNLPSVYVKVSHFISWIEQNIKN